MFIVTCKVPVCCVSIAMAMASVPESRTRWDFDKERKLIEVWADLLRELGGKMITWKKKEALATQQVKGTIQQPRGAYIDRDVNLNSRRGPVIQVDVTIYVHVRTYVYVLA